MNYKRLLKCFSLMTPLDINFFKSSLVSWEGNVSWVERMSSLLGCRLENLLITYLGMPLDGSCKKIEVLEPILVRIKAKLSIWRCKLLSKVGRAQLIK